MSEDSGEKIPSNSIAQTRELAEKEVDSIFPSMNPQERQVEVEVRTLESLNPNKLSIEFLTNFVRVKEKFYREKAIKDLADYGGSERAETSFDGWSELHDALKGAKGEGPVSATIDYFRDQASFQRDTVERIRRKLSGKDPIDLPLHRQLIEYINNISLNIPKFEKAAENYDTAARLFANRINFKVSETETPPTV